MAEYRKALSVLLSMVRHLIEARILWYRKGVTLVRLPHYSPELNPAEQIWNILRRNYFANWVFDSLDTATAQAEFGLTEMATNEKAVYRLTNWPWICDILNTK